MSLDTSQLPVDIFQQDSVDSTCNELTVADQLKLDLKLSANSNFRASTALSSVIGECSGSSAISVTTETNCLTDDCRSTTGVVGSSSDCSSSK